MIFSQKKPRTTLELIASIVIGALHAGRTMSFQALSKLGLIGHGSEGKGVNDAELVDLGSIFLVGTDL